MRDLIWDKTMSVEIDEIDGDHRILMGLFNTLNHSITEGEDPEYIDALMTELVNCTVWHFSHEERLMLKYKYNDAEDHREQHKDLLLNIQQLHEKFKKEKKLHSEEFLEFIELWLTKHILVADMELGRYLMEKI